MSKPPTGIYKVALEVLRPLAKLTTRPHWKGRENLPKDEPFILIMNHVTEYDIIVVAHFIVDPGHAVRVLAKDSLFRVPLLKHVLNGAKMVPVFRGSSKATDALKGAKIAISEGESIAIFPEGTLTRDPDKWPMKFKTGAARLALSTGAPVIPVAHWGGEKIMHRWRNSLPLRRRDTWVTAGPPIDLSDLNQDENDREAVVEATRRMEETIVRMVEELRGEKAPETLWDPKLEAYPPSPNA
ncbi:MAG: lysophospholipid acyltransferase family protein [Actinomycetaceae bacterium]|nr:lysophospholipid acyltransferase family protein [Actinomycetaceae bacterium]